MIVIGTSGYWGERGTQVRGRRPTYLNSWRIKFVAGTAALLCAAGMMRAQIISEALLAFPSQTESVEYDNLAALRMLPNYEMLRQRFSGKPLEQVKASLGKLDIQESQVNEVVMGSSAGAFYGLISGTFSAATAEKRAAKKGLFPLIVNDGQVYCPEGSACVLFLEDSLAAFGTSGQLKNMMEARQGVAGRLGSKRSLVYLMNKTDARAPVRGLASGSQLKSAIADALQDQSGLDFDWSRISSNLSAFSYSVKMDRLAHVSATLDCKSASTAGLLRQMLGALGTLQSVAAQAGKDPASMPFQNMQVSSSANIIDLKMDAPIPSQ